MTIFHEQTDDEQNTCRVQLPKHESNKHDAIHKIPLMHTRILVI